MKLVCVPGKGFNHEIVDDHAPTSAPVATVDASLDDGLELARLFAAAPAMREALHRIKEALAHGRTVGNSARGACQLAEDIADDALELVR